MARLGRGQPFRPIITKGIRLLTSDVTLALTGVAATCAVGTVGVALTLGLSGVAGTSASGTAAPGTTTPISGTTATGSVGSVTPSRTIAVTGVAGTGAVGTVAPTLSLGLTGASGTGSPGSLTPSTTIGLTGVSGTGAVGTVTPSGGAGGNVTTSITGVSATAAVGSVAPGTAATPTGVSGTSAVGSLGRSSTCAATGVGGTGGVGTPVPGISKAATGVAATTAVGSVTPSRAIALTGTAAAGAVGTMTSSGGDLVAVIVSEIHLEGRYAPSIALSGRAAQNMYAKTVLADSPEAYWRLGETVGLAVDATGHGHDGTHTGVTTRGVAGAIEDGDLAVSFDGSTGYITVPDDALLRPGLSDFTLELWLKRADTVAVEFLIGKAGGGTAADLELRLDARKIKCRVGGSTGVSVDSGSNVTDGVWHHIALSVDRDSLGTCYIDGVVDGTPVSVASQSAVNINSTAAFQIGRRALGNFFSGSLDDVAFYRSALSAAQVAAHYRDGRLSPGRLTLTGRVG